MSTSYYPQFDCYRIDSGGHRLVVASTTLNVTNVTAGGSLGTVSVDANGIVAQGSFSVAADTVVKFSHGTYPGTLQVTLQATQELAYTASYPEKKAAFGLENLGTATPSDSVQYYALDRDDAAAPPEYLGAAKVGTAVNIPYQTSVVKNLRIVPVSLKEHGGGLARTGFRDTTNYQDITIPPIDGVSGFKMSKFASLAAAVTAITFLVGTDPATLDIDADTTLSTATTVTVPDNILINYAGGIIHVTNSAGIVDIQCGVQCPDTVKFFAGTGTVYVTSGQDLHLEWWTGKPDGTTDYSHQLTQAIESQHQSTKFGGTLRVGRGVWPVKDIRRRPYTYIEGVVASIDMGAGGNPVEGSVFSLASGTSTCVFNIRAEPTAGGVAHDDQVPHMIGFSRVAITQRASTDSPCLLINGPLGQGIYDCIFRDCGFQGTYDGTSLSNGIKAVIKYDTDGSDIGFETIGQMFSNCWMEVGAYGKGVICDSTNTSFTFTNLHPICGIGAHMFHLSGAGWVDINNDDGRGAGGTYGSQSTVFYRTVTSATLTQYTDFGSGALDFTLMTITSGLAADEFRESDMGKIIDSDDFVGAYIIRIISPTQAILSWHPDDYAPFVNVECLLYGRTDQPNIAGTLMYVDGPFQQISLRNGVEEGFNFAAKIRGSPYYGRFIFDGYTCQGKVQLMGSCRVISKNSTYNALAWDDQANTLHPGEQAIVSFENDYVYHGTVHYAVALLQGSRWDHWDGARVMQDTTVYEDIYAYSMGGTPSIGFPGEISFEDDGVNIFTRNPFREKTNPLLQVGTPLISTSSDRTNSQVLIAVGPRNPAYPRQRWTGHQHLVRHSSYDEHVHVDGEHASAAWEFHFPIYATRFVSPQTTPANSSVTGTAGAIWADASYIYVQTASGTIKRVALSSF